MSRPQPLGTDESAPWKVELDLGASLRPRVLEAVALDATGEEVDRTVQRLNLPRLPAEVRIALARDHSIPKRCWENQGQ